MAASSTFLSFERLRGGSVLGIEKKFPFKIELDMLEWSWLVWVCVQKNINSCKEIRLCSNLKLSLHG